MANGVVVGNFLNDDVKYSEGPVARSHYKWYNTRAGKCWLANTKKFVVLALQ